MQNRNFLRFNNHTIDSIIVLSGVILLWKGIGGLLDYYIFPGYPLISDLISIVLGLAILYADDFSLSELGAKNYQSKKLRK